MEVETQNNYGQLNSQQLYPNQSVKSINSLTSSKLKYLGDQKSMKSHDFFKSTRVSSCSYVKLSNGTAKAVAYYNPQQKSYADKMSKSEYCKSLTHDTYKVRPNMRCGMNTKPLEAYTPNSYRNRLPILDMKRPTKNGSQIEVGDRSSQLQRQYVSESKNTYGNFGKNFPITNPGIISDHTKWHHKITQK